MVSRTLLVFLILGTFAAAAGFFATVQTIWVDETTQLSGATLHFQEQLRWLLGRSDVVLGVPPDRMPPLSYWLGSIWAAIFGLSEISMRWFGIVAVLAAAPALFLAGHHVASWRGGLFCLTFCLLSPNVLVYAVEIRAYPLFFTFCAWGSFFFTRLVVDHEDRAAARDFSSLILLAVFVLAAAYTHFYGLVFGVCILGALIADRMLRGEALAAVLGIAGITAILSLGIAPFALAAVNVSGGSAVSEAALFTPTSTTLYEISRDTARLAIRTIIHGSHFVYLAAAGLTALGAISLGILALSEKDTFREGAVLFSPIIIALPLLAGLSLLISSFDVLAPHYNLWMLPLVTIFLSSALRANGSSWRIQAAQVGGAVVIAGNLAASTVFLLNARYFTHGPGEWVATMITDPARTLVVHDGNGPWAHVYFPIHYMTDGAVAQVMVQPNGELVWVTSSGLVPVDENKVAILSRFDSILAVSARNRDSIFLAERINSAESCGGGEIDFLGIDSMTSPELYCSYVAATLIRTVQAPK